VPSQVQIDVNVVARKMNLCKCAVLDSIASCSSYVAERSVLCAER